MNNKAGVLYTLTRDSKDIDLVTMVSKLIEDKVGSIPKDKFLTHSYIIDIKDKVPEVQRVIINRYFNNLLYLFRSKCDVEVLEPLLMLVNDGTINDWFNLIKQYVIPFISINNVYGVVYQDTIIPPNTLASMK